MMPTQSFLLAMYSYLKYYSESKSKLTYFLFHVINLFSELVIISFSGPFWVCATLVFTTAIAGNLASYLMNSGDHQWVYDFHKGILYVVFTA